MGFPYFGWLTAIFSIPVRIANQFDIGITFYGEDGEVEYGGHQKQKRSLYSIAFICKKYIWSLI